MPSVFISYRQIDDAQRLRVRAFADRIRGCGINVILDQFFKDSHPGGPPEGWPKWSSDRAIHSERVLIIGNTPWFRCFDGTEIPGTGLGATCEAGNIRQRLYDLSGLNDIIRVAYFDKSDVDEISFDLKRYDRFHFNDHFSEPSPGSVAQLPSSPASLRHPPPSASGQTRSMNSNGRSLTMTKLASPSQSSSPAAPASSFLPSKEAARRARATSSSSSSTTPAAASKAAAVRASTSKGPIRLIKPSPPSRRTLAFRFRHLRRISASA